MQVQSHHSGRFWLHALLGLLLLSLTGCVWLRLLEIKNQLADFDEYIRVEIVEGHFVVRFLEPVLLSKDFVELSKLHPSRTTDLAEGYRWFLDFHFRTPHNPEQAAKVISFAMTFTPEHKMSSFSFSPLFLQMAPKAFLEASIRSLGLGKVDQGKRQMRVDPDDLPGLSDKLPTRKEIVEVLGPPEEDYVYDNYRIIRYRFLSDSKPISPKHEDRREAEAKLFFDPATESLVRLSGRFAGLKLSIDYRKLTKEGRSKAN